MLTRILVTCAFSVALAACGAFSGGDRMAGTSGSSGAYGTAPSGTSIPSGSTAGSSGGLTAGPPGGIANNQLDRISQ